MKTMKNSTHETKPVKLFASYQVRVWYPTPERPPNHSASSTAFQPMITAKRNPATT